MKGPTGRTDRLLGFVELSRFNHCTGERVTARLNVAPGGTIIDAPYALRLMIGRHRDVVLQRMKSWGWNVTGRQEPLRAPHGHLQIWLPKHFVGNRSHARV
jgi:hypothetical protein